MVHYFEPKGWIESENECVDVIIGHLRRLVDLPKNLVGLLRVHVVIRMPLDSEQEGRASCVPAVLLIHGLPDTTLVLFA